MKLFLKNCGRYLLIILLCSISIYFILNEYILKDSYAWGNPLLNKKITHLQSSSYNLCTLGSSKIFRQFNPDLFDNLSNNKYSSFNLGVEGTFPPETYYAAEKVLNNPPKDLKTLILEVRAIEGVRYQNLHTIQSYYWLNTNRLKTSEKLIMDSPQSMTRKFYNFFTTLTAYIDQTINIGKGQYLISAENVEDDINFRNNSGYEPLENKEIDSIANENLRQASIAAFSQNADIGSKVNQSHLIFLSKIDSLAKSKGIKVYFLMAENQKAWMYKELVPLFSQLPREQTLIISDANKYPFLYEAQNKANLSHLNSKGANYFTKAIFDEIQNRETNLP